MTLSGKALNPELFIVARANRNNSVPKLVQAGADRVVNPHEIGGNRMASLLVQPTVADYVAEALRDGRLEALLREFAVAPGSRLDGATLRDSGLLDATGVTVLAIRGASGAFTHHPGPDDVLRSGDVAVALGTAEQHRHLVAWLDGVRSGAAE